MLRDPAVRLTLGLMSVAGLFGFLSVGSGLKGDEVARSADESDVPVVVLIYSRSASDWYYLAAMFGTVALVLGLVLTAVAVWRIVRPWDGSTPDLRKSPWEESKGTEGNAAVVLAVVGVVGLILQGLALVAFK